jgi:hypothetical protein
MRTNKNFPTSRLVAGQFRQFAAPFKAQPGKKPLNDCCVRFELYPLGYTWTVLQIAG